MSVPPPHYLLFSQAHPGPGAVAAGGRWHFVLQSLAGETELEAADREPAPADRLELLAVVRGLEALEQPSRVTLVTPSNYVCHGLRFGVPEWRENDFQWERFGELKPIKNSDLWKRLDHALQIHQVDCRSWRLETNDDLNVPEFEPVAAAEESELAARPPKKKRMLRIDGAHTTSAQTKNAEDSAEKSPWEQLQSLWEWMLPKPPAKAKAARGTARPARPKSRRPRVPR
jgi:ribonuclease HI